VADVQEFLTTSRFETGHEYLDEKAQMLAALELSHSEMIGLARTVHEAVTAWRPEHPIEQMLQIVALAAVVDSSRAAEAISQAIQEIIPVFRKPKSSSDLAAAETIVRLAVGYFKKLRFNTDYTDFVDLVESEVQLKPQLLAEVAALLIDERKRGGNTVDLKRVLGRVFSHAHFAKGDPCFLGAFTESLTRQMPAEYWADKLPELKFQASEEENCHICQFIRTIFDRERPFLLMVNLRPSADWLLSPTKLGATTNLGPEEFESLVRSEGYELAPSEHLPKDLRGDEFFDRVANARSRSSAYVRQFRNNVVKLFPRGDK